MLTCPIFLVFSPKQQAKMAAYCVSIFGDMLLDKPLDEFPVSHPFAFCFFCVHLSFLLERKNMCSIGQWELRGSNG